VTKTNGGCDERVAELERWFDSLPKGVAELITTGGPGCGERVFQIAPIDNLVAARMRIEFGSHDFAVRAGQRFWAPDMECSRESPVPYCQAVVEGELAEWELLRKGEVVGWETRLLVGRKRLQGRRFFDPAHERWWSGWRRFLPGGKRRRVSYSPYYELLPLASDPSKSVLIKPPVFEYHREWAEVYLSAADVEGYLEPWYVGEEEGDNPWYDSAGRLLRLIGSGPEVEDSREWWVRMQCVEPVPRHADELRAALVEMLSSAGRSRDQLSGASLQELVRGAMDYTYEL
jgi:hypothetical protein